MGDWSRGMILVSGTRGPGFNSRIAPIFALCNQMTDRTDESFEAEEIINVRLQNYSMAARLQEQDKLAKMAELYRQVLSRLIDVLSDRTTAVQRLATTLGIKAGIERDYSDLKFVKGGKESEATVFRRLEKLNMQLDVQDELLGLVNQSVGQLVKDHQQLKSKLQKVNRQHTLCGEVSSLANQHFDKLKQLEKVMEQKDVTFLQLQKIKQSYEEELELSTKKNEEYNKQIQTLQKEVKMKSREIQANRDILESAEEASKQKQRVLDNCQKLLQMITVPHDDYLKCHFRNSGLSLEPPRQQKNKYSIVFDN